MTTATTRRLLRRTTIINDGGRRRRAVVFASLLIIVSMILQSGLASLNKVRTSCLFSPDRIREKGRLSKSRSKSVSLSVSSSPILAVNLPRPIQEGDIRTMQQLVRSSHIQNLSKVRLVEGPWVEDRSRRLTWRGL